MSGQKGWEPLGNDFKTALDQLRIDEKERDAFTTYLSFAADNLGKLFDVERGFSSRGPVREAFKKKENARRVEQVAHFIWLFRDNAPKQNYPDYTNVAERIIQKIVELRNCFVHIHDRPVSSGELIVDQEFYRLIEGKLFGEARDAALGKIGLNTGKLGKMRLFNRHERFDDDPGKTTYEFTRKGLIFLVCLVLYRDDAFEFCSHFEDLQLPPLRKDDVAYARYQL